MPKPSTYFLSVLLLCGLVVFAAIRFTGGARQAAAAGYSLHTEDFALTLSALRGKEAATFLARLGLSAEQGREIRRLGCLFQLHLRGRGEGKGPVVVEYSTWDVIADGESYHPWYRDVWRRVLPRLSLSAKQQLAFEAALLAEDIAAHAGDEARGVVAFALLPGQPFALMVRWQRDGKPSQARLDGLRCPVLPAATAPTQTRKPGRE